MDREVKKGEEIPEGEIDNLVAIAVARVMITQLLKKSLGGLKVFMMLKRLEEYLKV